MRKKKLDEAALKVEADEMEEGEGLGDGGSADLTALAKQIDLDEIKAVLRVSLTMFVAEARLMPSAMVDTGNSITFPSYESSSSG
jgi:hypothetical protein